MRDNTEINFDHAESIFDIFDNIDILIDDTESHVTKTWTNTVTAKSNCCVCRV